jgi:DNA-directed RNA polymerase subunit RPC12/RpoP
MYKVRRCISMIAKVIVVVLIGIFVLFIAAKTGILIEKRGYNNGYCPHCGAPLELFDIDSQRGRGYVCDNCEYSIWVSYRSVDKNRHKRQGMYQFGEEESEDEIW